MGLLITTYAASKAAKLRYMDENFGGFKEVVRRNLLMTHAERLSKEARSGAISDCAAFASILAYAVTQFVDANDMGVEAMMEDLRAVLIGKGLENAKRNTGTSPSGSNPFWIPGLRKNSATAGIRSSTQWPGYISVMRTVGWVLIPPC